MTVCREDDCKRVEQELENAPALGEFGLREWDSILLISKIKSLDLEGVMEGYTLIGNVSSYVIYPEEEDFSQ